MGKFEDLNVWNKAMNLVTDIYKITSKGKIMSDFGLKEQIQRSAVSIPSNIAEGDELNTQKQSLKHFYIAKGSSAELYTQLLIAKSIGFLEAEKADYLTDSCREISAMLQKLIRYRSGIQDL